MAELKYDPVVSRIFGEPTSTAIARPWGSVNERIRNKKGFIIDMDGVVYTGDKLIPGMKEVLDWLKRENKKYLFLTNNSAPSARELQQKLARLGLDVSEEHFFTSGWATASFLASQKPNGTAYVIGEAGLYNALYTAGFTMNSVNPDYVVVGESTSHNYEKIAKAVDLVRKGAKLIGTNPDVSGPIEGGGVAPATGAFVSTIELAANRKAFFVGKPNPIMMRHAMRRLGLKSKDVAIIGDRMDTDILAGVEAEVDTVLVLTGVTSREDLVNYSYSPVVVFNSIAELLPKPTSIVREKEKHPIKS